jgi:hypothetical protein
MCIRDRPNLLADTLSQLDSLSCAAVQIKESSEATNKLINPLGFGISSININISDIKTLLSSIDETLKQRLNGQADTTNIQAGNNNDSKKTKGSFFKKLLNPVITLFKRKT